MLDEKRKIFSIHFTGIGKSIYGCLALAAGTLVLWCLWHLSLSLGLNLWHGLAGGSLGLVSGLSLLLGGLDGVVALLLADLDFFVKKNYKEQKITSGFCCFLARSSVYERPATAFGALTLRRTRRFKAASWLKLG